MKHLLQFYDIPNRSILTTLRLRRSRTYYSVVSRTHVKLILDASADNSKLQFNHVIRNNRRWALLGSFKRILLTKAIRIKSICFPIFKH